MTETTAVTCCVPGSIGVEPASIAFSAAANGCGDEPPPSTIAVMRPSERFDAAASACALARASATAALRALR